MSSEDPTHQADRRLEVANELPGAPVRNGTHIKKIEGCNCAPCASNDYLKLLEWFPQLVTKTYEGTRGSNFISRMILKKKKKKKILHISYRQAGPFFPLMHHICITHMLFTSIIGKFISFRQLRIFL